MITTRRCSGATKLLTLRVRTYNKAKYAAKFCSWPRERYIQLDKHFRTAIKSIARLLPSHPHDLIHLPQSVCGLNIPSFNETVQDEKAGVQHRASHAHRNTRDAAESMYARAIQYSNQHPSTHQCATITVPTSTEQFWLDSLVEQYDSLNISIKHGGFDMYNTRDEPITHAIERCNISITAEAPNVMSSIGILTIGDILTYQSNIDTSDESTLTTVPHIHSFFDNVFLTNITLPVNMQHQTILRPGRCWLSSQPITDHFNMQGIVEILGCEHDDDEVGYSIRYWIAISPDPDIYTIHPRTPSLGISTTLRPYYTDIFPLAIATRAILTADTSNTTGVERRLEYTLLQPTPKPFDTPLDQLPYINTNSSWDTLSSEFTPERLALGTLYTDGSWKRVTPTFDTIFYRENHAVTHASSAIVLKSNSPLWKDAPTYAIRLISDDTCRADSAFPMELLGIAGAARLATKSPVKISIKTDCLSAKLILDQPHKMRKHVYKPQVQLLRAILGDMNRSGANKPSIIQVHSHKGDHIDISEWTDDIWGNEIADRVAAGDTDFCQQHNIHYITIHVNTLLAVLPHYLSWYLHDNSTNTLLMDRPKHIADQQRFNSYIQKRDDYRTARGEQPKWAESTIRYASKIHFHSKMSLQSRAAAQRIVYDKGWHGGNRVKSATAETSNDDRDSFIKCDLCNQQDHQDHHIRYCLHADLDTIRDHVLQDLFKYVIS